MNPLWSERLREAWQELAGHFAQSRAYRTRRLSDQLQLDVHAALRAVDNAPCLVIEGIAPAEDHFEVGGMRLGVVRDERGPLLVLSLEDRDRIDLFTTVCADAISASEGNDRSLLVFLDRLEAWRRFLRERNSGLSREEATGLIGELLVLRELIALDRSAFGFWAAPDDGLHDFHREGHALEVKSSLGPSSQVRIATLDQLDTTGLRRLDLLHVRLIESPEGTTLGAIVSDIVTRLEEPSRRTFENALLRRGLMPDDTVARSSPHVEIRTIEAYNVGAAFPRLDRTSVPQAVSDAQYALDVRALTGFSTSASSVLEQFQSGASV
ncbi:PD-(D/E)XK motif protein [Bradyrhizobium sp. AZCC 2289]|uniref:PD-(D/E)XK motif protein n=1 Tax=Bradyrhizobium sp. AZCC 2289 TaxID=3117026 RepID=UPI002FF3A7E0